MNKISILKDADCSKTTIVNWKRPFSRIGVILALFVVSITGWSQSNQLRPVDYVNPLIGTAPMLDPDHIGNNPAPNEDLYYGSVNPGAKVPDPNGGFCLGPVSGYDGCCYHVRGSGYRYDDGSIMGFTHFNGQYSGDNYLLFMPTVGEIRTDPGTRENPFLGYRSLKDDHSEKASPGFYTVLLTTYGIKVELTATKNCGYHRYTFPASSESNVLIDLSNCRPEAKDTYFKIIDNRTIEGFQEIGGRRVNKIYFYVEFNKDFENSGTWNTSIVYPESISANRNPFGAYVTFNTSDGEEVLVKVGTSTVSQEDAKSNLKSEIGDKDFDKIHQEAVSQWEKVLSYITIEGGTESDRENFYSCMYRLTEGPSYAGNWQGGSFCTPWTVRVFMRGWQWYKDRLVNRDNNNLGSNWLWSGEFWGIGGAWAPLGMYNRGFDDFDMEAIYAKMKEEAMTGGGAIGDAYRKYGYVPFGVVNNCINHCLGLPYSDHVVAEYAKFLGKKADYKYFSERSKNYKNVYNKSVGFFMPRNADGSWLLVDPFDVHAESIYREGNAWNYLFYVMGDVPGLIDLMGGNKAFVSRLDELFNTPMPKNAFPLRDVTGFYGLYAHGNEPFRHIPFLYNYAGVPWKTQEIVRKLQKELHRPTPDGMCGMEDYGQLSGWYVSSAMGFYHVDNLTGDCDICSPLFPKVTINMDGPNPERFVIEAHNVSDENIYIQSAMLNGKPLNVPKFHHKDIIAGGSLVFEMGPKPNYNWGVVKTSVK
ncbi:MAG TPA: GH92 family glycosyl hydrolase [Prolixibacteraceae bacterium]|nr:GH92 family glycosyl hydrolase [Prolixibacteraceae bacterium]